MLPLQKSIHRISIRIAGDLYCSFREGSEEKEGDGKRDKNGRKAGVKIGSKGKGGKELKDNKRK